MAQRSTLLTLALLITFGGAAADESREMVTITLPIGDASAGREAFKALSCVSCHRVAGEQDFPETVSANRGPTLGGFLGDRPASDVAMSIVEPSHDIDAVVRRGREDGLSPMGKFTATMTVKQFQDLIAYLRSLPKTLPAE